MFDDNLPSYVERFKRAQLDAIAHKEAPEEAPSSFPFTDQELARLAFYKWLYEHGRLTDNLPVVEAC